MPLVVGVDSSTSATKVQVRDADTGALVVVGSRAASGRRPRRAASSTRATGRPRSAPRARRPGLPDVAPAGGHLRSAVSSTGWSCSTLDGEVLRPAKLWNDTESAADADALIAALPDGAAGWADACGSVPLAAFTITKLALVAPLRARGLRACRAGAASARLAHHAAHRRRARPIAATRRAPATGRRPRARYRTDLLGLVDDTRRLGCRAPDRARPDRGGRGVVRGRRRRGSGHRRQHGRRARARAAPRRSRAQLRHEWHCVRGERPRQCRSDRDDRRVRRRDGPLPSARVHAERDEGHRRDRAPARRDHRAVRRARARRAARCRTASCSCRTSTANARRTAPTRPARSPACASDVTAAQIARAAVEGVVCNLLEGADALVPDHASPDGRIFLIGGGAHSHGVPPGRGRPHRSRRDRPDRRASSSRAAPRYRPRSCSTAPRSRTSPPRGTWAWARSSSPTRPWTAIAIRAAFADARGEESAA